MVDQVKPTCVCLAAQPGLNRGSATSTLQLLSTLQHSLLPLIQADLAQSKSLAAYIFFPLSKLLQQNSFDTFAAYQSVLASLLACLAAWLRPQKEPQSQTLAQLWLVASLILGGPLDHAPPQSPWDEDVHHTSVDLLRLILDRPDPPNVQRTVLAHTITALLSPACGSNTPLRVKALQTLSPLFIRHPQFKDEGLDVQFLPGLISGLIKILTNSGEKTKTPGSRILVPLLDLMADALSQVIGNHACHAFVDRSQQIRIERLEDLATLFPNTQQPSTQTDAPETLGDPTKRSKKWLESTTHQIHLSWLAILPTLRQLDHLDSRLAFARLCVRLLDDTDQTLREETLHLVRMEVCALVVDQWPQVRDVARQVRRTANSSRTYVDILSQALLRLSSDVTRHGDDAVKLGWSLNVLQGSATLLLDLIPPSTYFRGNPLASDTWALSLLRSVQFARFPGLQDAANTGGGDKAARAWIAPAPTLLSADTAPSSGAAEQTSFPHLPMKRIPPHQLQQHLASAIRLLGQLYVHTGQTTAIEQFLEIATGGLPHELRASAWWIVSELTACLGGGKDEHEKLLRRIVQFACDVEEKPTEARRDPADEDSTAVVERVKGLQVDSILADYTNVDNETSRAESAARARKSSKLVSICMALRTLSAAAEMLETDFRSQLLFCLYPILAHLGPSAHPLVREHAEVTLQRIAFHAGYASTVNLVLDNVDYVINAVSQRLLLSSLDPRAPQVLIAAVRLVGAPVVPLLQDIVDDIFDALDSYHGYTTLCASLLAVLDCIVKSIAQDEAGQRREKPTPVYKAPDPVKDLGDFSAWLRERRVVPDPEEEVVDPFEGKPSEEAFKKWAEEAARNAEPPRNDDKPDPPTKVQAACSAILNKSLYFLSHESSFLRARVLALISSTIAVLGSQSRESEMLPFIHKSWPIIMNRLTAVEELYVVAEAAGLVQELATQVGDYVCRKILDDVWPRFKQLMQHQASLDATHTLTAQSMYTSSHRLHEAIFETMRLVAEEVPLRDGMEWDIAMTLRQVLVTTRDASLVTSARSFYDALGGAAPEGVWLALRGAISEGTELPRFLLVSKTLHISSVLQGLQPSGR